MYAFIRGKLVKKGRDRVHLETKGGVGYEIFISQSERNEFPEPGEELLLHTHLHVREDNLQLFGFITRSTRDFFRDLLPQKGIGPKLAVSILSDLGAEDFRKAVHRQDTEALKSVKGVGKKTAKRLIVEMGEKLPEPGEDTTVDDPLYDEAVQGLRGLGFSKDRAADAVRKALNEVDPDEKSLENLIGRGLEELEGN
jgi:Holliday junction DNA helicase RuvA